MPLRDFLGKAKDGRGNPTHQPEDLLDRAARRPHDGWGVRAFFVAANTGRDAQQCGPARFFVANITF